MTQYHATVHIEAATAEEAAVVLAERLCHDEDYGFTYALGYDAPVETPTNEGKPGASVTNTLGRMMDNLDGAA